MAAQEGSDLTLQLLSHAFVEVNRLNGKGEDGAAYLDRHRMILFQFEVVFQQDNCAKFAAVVFNVETVRFTLYDRVAPGYRDVIDTNFTFVATTQLEFILFFGNC